MKNAITFLSLALAALPLGAVENGVMTDTERDYLVNQLEQSKNNVLESIAGLTPAQWRFKPAPDKWSVAECAEHIILAEDFIFGAAKQTLKTPTVPRPENSNAMVDQKIVAGVTDRSNKRSAPEQLVPSGRFETPATAADAFKEKRDRTIAYAKSTQDDLRVHVLAGPAGPMDGYQYLLLLAAHSARHTAQIREVEANSEFPKATADLRMSPSSVGFD